MDKNRIREIRRTHRLRIMRQYGAVVPGESHVTSVVGWRMKNEGKEAHRHVNQDCPCYRLSYRDRGICTGCRKRARFKAGEAMLDTDYMVYYTYGQD